MKRALLILALAFSTLNTMAQCSIWSEDFSSNSDGDVIGNDNQLPAGPDWTATNCSSCMPSIGDWWEVRSGRLEARDVNSELVRFQTEVIDISSHVNVSFSILCSEAGDHEGYYLATVANRDLLYVYYRIDGGTWSLISNHLGWCGLYGVAGAATFSGDDNSNGDCRISDFDWGTQTVFVSGLAGSTLEIRVDIMNSAADEYTRIDNICVNSDGILPIELISFDVQAEYQKAKLEWSTASETNNDIFYIERSNDAQQFSSIGNIDGAGNSIHQIDYLFYDDKPLNGVSYYRVKQIDFNGEFSYSPVQAIEFKFNTISVSIQGEHLILQGAKEGSEVLIRDVSGRLLSSNVFQGTNIILNSNFKRQVLIIELFDGNSSQAFRTGYF